MSRIISATLTRNNGVYFHLAGANGRTAPLVTTIGSHVYVSTENILPDKPGVASFGTTDFSERVTYFQAEDVLVSNIRPYFKKMWFATTSGGCNADVLCFRALDKKYAYLLKSIMFQDGFFDYVMSGAKGTKMPRGDKTHIMLYPIPRFSETQLLKFIEYNKISFGEGGRMRSLSRVSRKQRYNTLDFAEQNRVPTGMLAPLLETQRQREFSPLNSSHFLRR
mgnify:CR=1 FL=1